MRPGPRSLAQSRRVIADLLSVDESTLSPASNYRKDTELWEHGGSVYCAPVGWYRPPAKYTWRHAGYAKGRPVFIKTGEKE